MKRFSDTKRFDEAWYGDLSIDHKIAYEYVWARADNAGVWSPNFKLADFQLGKKIDWTSLPSKTGKRVQALPSGLWVLVGFVETQCGVLSVASRPHAVVISLLKGYGLLKNDSLSIEYPESTDALLDKYKEKEKDKDPKGSPEGKQKMDRGTIEEITAFCVAEGLPSSDGVACFHKWEGNGWKNGTAPIKCWRSTIRAWKASGYMPSQKAFSGSNGHRPKQTEAQRDQANTGLPPQKLNVKIL